MDGLLTQVGPEEYACLVRMKELKAQYRDTHTDLKLVQSEVEYTTRCGALS
jgi:hypothetical protein